MRLTLITSISLALLELTAGRLEARTQSTDTLTACPPVRPSVDTLPASRSVRPSARSPAGFTIGASVDRFSFPAVEDAHTTMVSIRLSHFEHDGLSRELTLATAPSSLKHGFPFLMVDLSLMPGIPLGSATLMVGGGLSAVLAAGILPGVHLGLGVVIPVIPQFSVRLDAVYRPFVYEMVRLDSYSIGVGLMTLPGLDLGSAEAEF
jgi:hypothetical protein